MPSLIKYSNAIAVGICLFVAVAAVDLQPDPAAIESSRGTRAAALAGGAEAGPALHAGGKRGRYAVSLTRSYAGNAAILLAPPAVAAGLLFVNAAIERLTFTSILLPERPFSGRAPPSA